MAAVAPIAAAWIASDATKSAASKQADATKDANATQYAMWQQQFNATQPWRTAGAGGVNYLAYLMGIPGYESFAGTFAPEGRTPRPGGPAGIQPEGKTPRPHGAFYQQKYADDRDPNGLRTGGLDSVGGPGTGMVPTGSPTYGGGTPGAGFGSLMHSFGMNDFQADPGYGFRLSEGQKALERSAAARGGLLSGAAMKASQRYGQDMASQEYGNAYNRFNNDRTQQFNRLAALAGIGQTANSQINQAGQNYANNVSANQMALGNALGASSIAQGNAWGNAANQLGNAWMQYGMMNNNSSKDSWWG